MASQQQSSQSAESPVLRGVRWFFRFLLRFLFVVILGLVIGWAAYSAIPWIYRNVVQGVQKNTVLIESLDERLKEQDERLQGQDDKLRQRIDEVENEVTTLQGASDVQAQDIQGAAEQIEQLDARIAGLEEDLEKQDQAVKALRSSLDSAVEDLGDESDQIAGQTAELEARLVLLQTAQDLLKVRFLLLEGSSRDANDTLALAAAHLAQALPLMPDQEERLSALQERVAGLAEIMAVNEGDYRVGLELEALWADVMDLVLPVVVPAEGEATS